MSAIKRIIELNIHNKELEEAPGTGSERIEINSAIIEQEQILKDQIGPQGFNEVIDAVVDFIEGNSSEKHVWDVYARWT
ncbi:hypothetical protein [Bacillus subtilis]|uniref:hypothetical protein n=1 Tax=Bacillus subtilis TaxID=1423 RepID=UPI00217D4751|nr:hypothetical protein [Bacillus subtilis]MEC0399931.1 hypothetical protein [Bacillus subtilis]MEC0429294.1 hypothetical protein [Bacillus subtilis]UWJ02613.1 hypothetical protein N0B18_06940 [Bacillus subtilis]WRK89107.1 hypothetical protein U7118_07690 [Bacillus subtilis]